MTMVDTVPAVLDTGKLRRLRIKKGLTQAQAASAAGLSGKQRWWEIESGAKANLTIDTLNRVAAALGVRAKDLLK